MINMLNLVQKDKPSRRGDTVLKKCQGASTVYPCFVTQDMPFIKIPIKLSSDERTLHPNMVLIVQIQNFVI